MVRAVYRWQCHVVNVVKVTGLLSQGRGEGDEWVTSFLVSYSLDAYHWLYVTDQYGNQRVMLAVYYTPVYLILTVK